MEVGLNTLKDNVWSQAALLHTNSPQKPFTDKSQRLLLSYRSSAHLSRRLQHIPEWSPTRHRISEM